MLGEAVAISSREDCAAVGLLELADLVDRGPGKRPGDVAEQFALQQRFGQRTAGDFDERPVAATAAAVNRPGDHRLAGAALARDQHRGPGVGNAVDHVEDALHAVIVTDDVFQAEARVELGLEPFVLLDDLALRQGPVDRHLQLLVHQRLGEQVECAGSQGLNADLHRAVARDQNHRQTRMVATAVLQNLEPVPVTQTNVGQDQVVPALIDQGLRLAASGGHVDMVALITEPAGHGIQDMAVIVHQKKGGLIHHAQSD